MSTVALGYLLHQMYKVDQNDANIRELESI